MNALGEGCQRSAAKFKTRTSNKAYDVLTEGGFFADAWTAAEEGTFHDFTGTAEKELGRIDWIFTRGTNVSAEQPRIEKYKKAGQYPSDHFPVWTRVRY